MGPMPLDQATGTLQDTTALWSIDAVSPQAVVGCACDALIAGLDSPSLRILAGLTRAEADYQVLDILPAALAELGLDSAVWLAYGLSCRAGINAACAGACPKTHRKARRVGCCRVGCVLGDCDCHAR